LKLGGEIAISITESHLSQTRLERRKRYRSKAVQLKLQKYGLPAHGGILDDTPPNSDIPCQAGIPIA
jgi:hypothetical protein